MALGVGCVHLRVFDKVPSVHALGSDCCAEAAEALALLHVVSSLNASIQKVSSSATSFFLKGACQFKRHQSRGNGYMQAIAHVEALYQPRAL